LLEKEDKSFDFGTLLQAFDYGLADSYNQPGGDIELKERIHQAWFSPVDGGTWWELTGATVDLSKEGHPETPDRTTPAIGAAELAALNLAQQAADLAQRHLESAQLDLYQRWWKMERLPHLGAVPTGLSGDPAAAVQLTGAAGRVTTAQTTLTTKRQALD